MQNTDEDNGAAGIMMYILAIGILPLLVTLGIYIKNPTSPVLNAIAISSSELPALLSTNNLLLSKVMSTYCKTAPFSGLLFFLFFHDRLNIKKQNSKEVITKALIFFSFLYTMIIYFLLLHDINLTESGRFIRFMSGNDYLMTLTFTFIFSVCYIFTCYFLSFIYASFYILKNK